MDIKKVFDLMDKAEKSSFDRIKIEIQDFKISLERNCGSAAVVPCCHAESELPVAAAAKQSPPASEEAEDDIIFAPISGVFYAAKEPGAEPFVKEGCKVAKGEPICIIEAMKMMNEICAPRAGVIERVLASDGQAIQANDALFVYEKGD